MAPDDAAADKPWLPRTIDAVIARVLRLRIARAGLLYSSAYGPALADGITYRALFSVFAALLLGFSAAALWLSGNPDALAALVSAVKSAVPGLVGEGGLVKLGDIDAPAGLSIAGVVSLIGLVGAALGAIGSLRIALRTLAGEVTDDVLWYWVILRNVGLAAGIAVAFLLTAVATVISGAGVSSVASFLGIAHSEVAAWAAGIVAALIVYVLDAAVIVGLFAVLSGVRAGAKLLWQGGALGAVGLLVLQQVSSLFVGGAKSNPLLASFAALIALLLWMNLSAQVVLLASAWIIRGVEEEQDRAAAHPRSLAEVRLDRAERRLDAARKERDAARAAVDGEQPTDSSERAHDRDDADSEGSKSEPPAAQREDPPHEQHLPWYRRLLRALRRRRKH